ncbi:C10 family peptidase [Xylanibacter muris]|uniref:Leucine-rich repeat protein n=1 Tax=Xylanibacter muris TaxID=2736290 RepID=A0ABX2AMQ9_9BACT|nr:C10 family peptidase [Xylanibacter muris]NPD92513.1 leucine-rich repeat protein [Xylanibacter muris]
MNTQNPAYKKPSNHRIPTHTSHTWLSRTSVTLIFIFICISYGLAQYHGHREELDVIYGKMRPYGITEGRQHWRVTEEYDELSICENTADGMFAIVAKAVYEPYLKSRLLAYSLESAFNGTESAWKKNLISSYREQLRMLQATGKPRISASAGFHIEEQPETKPLTKSRWGQDYPYNNDCPIIIPPSTRTLTGCVATAVSQLMFYHRHPQKGNGQYTGGNENGRTTIDFEKTYPDWNMMQNIYPATLQNAATVQPVAELMGINAKATSSKFKVSGTASDNLAARTVLVNFWRYSPECRFIQSDNIRMLCRLINEDLAEGRPVLVSGGTHSFLCDGYRDGYYHFNLGWRGAANGYYKLLLDDSIEGADSKHHIIDDIVCNIRPDDGKKSHKTINIMIPGTLGKLLTEAEMLDLTGITIRGKLNGTDIALIRRMAGATDGWRKNHVETHCKPGEWTGRLQRIDLSAAEFTRDKTKPYLRLKAEKGSFSYGGKQYDLEKGLSQEEYRKFLKSPISHGQGYRYVEYKSEPCIEFYPTPDGISPMMFFDCQNITEIQLPANTRRISGQAFLWCNSLNTISLPTGVKEVESGAFAQCYLLHEVCVTTIPAETIRNGSPFKSEGRYGEHKNLHHMGVFYGNNIYTCRGFVKNNKTIPDIEYKKTY